MNKQLLILMALFVSVIGYSQTFTATDANGNNLQYTVTSATTVALISGSTINNVNVDIPASVSNTGTTYSVTAINNFALGGGTQSLSSVSLPNTIVSIGQQAFSGNNLTGIVLPNGITSIGDYAFQNNQLQGLTIPSSVTNIGNGAFRYNPLTAVTSLATTPPSITTVAGGNDSFVSGGDRSNIDLTIPAGTTGSYVTDTGALWTGFNTVTENLNIGDTYIDNFITYEVTSASMSTMKAVDYSTAGGSVVDIPATIPNGLITYTVTEIGDFAFQSKNLTNVTLPNTITHVGENAFFINNLTALTIPDSVITIDDGAFAQNQSMTNLVLGNNITTIGDFSFRFIPLNTITIPASVTDIGLMAFGGFGGNQGIMDIFCLGTTPPTIVTGGSPNNDSFNQARSLIDLHIPVGTVGSYVTDSGALWTGFNSVTEDALSIDEFELANNIKVITTTDQIEVIFPNSIRLENYTIYSISGTKVATGTKSEISTTSFSKGIYILKLDFDRGVVTKKVIIN